MLDMFVTDVADLAVSNPQAATAIATSDLVAVTFALVLVTAGLVFAGVIVGLLQIRVVWLGIDKMTKANKKRDRRHKKTMKAEARRHKEAMEAERNRHREAMKALNALIRNTGHRNRPAPAR